MASTFSIPRFLLPRSGLLWRGANLGSPRAARTSITTSTETFAVRYASSSSSNIAKDAKGKPIVLEKPARFNPPSHGARLPSKKSRPQQHYGGDLSADDAAAQRRRDYPGMMAPQGTWAHWFWGSRWLHLCITTGTLFSLAVYTYSENFKATSPFAEMLPSGADFWQHPIISLRTAHEVWKLTTLHNSAVVADKRKKKVDDVAKRSEYRKAHGLEQKGGFGNWTAREDDPEKLQAPPGKREKWLGIF
ncbi:hypothetical protein M406DRAFT_356243 [Cryphonectria parasitica EP155]|uniref:Uncharacterized protein n=1 Tax=Cryphonectria parasitica (strain ATCC 38755 / EP155) TaxID=660469 RepID=A0A9P4Y4Z5_CRYP1|nr:uncharacterized protein M406DRAFT_356243 [Cryphonectria parasitica EP155]KAF3766230.1 hypothetical protein M406DRAFT_356243 [Cryphonectria parasitica EP155]